MNMIGIRIKQRRKELHLTQMQIKDKVGISSGNMSDLENGNATPSASTLILLSQVLMCSVDWILTGKTRCYENSDSRIAEIEKMFYELEEFDKNEVLQIVKMKYSRVKGDEKSYLSDQAKIDTEIA